MKVTIAGRELKPGDRLYHMTHRSFGTVLRIQPTTAEVQFHTTHGTKFKVYVNDGGMVSRKKLIYWHKPLDLDFPHEDISKIQAVLDAVIGAMK